MSANKFSFMPATGMANPHVQTILSSMGRKLWPSQAQTNFHAASQRELIEVHGVQLAVDLSISAGKPLIMLIPGWLGSSTSSYALSCAT